MIDDVPVDVRQVAVAAVADAALADVGGDIAAADIQRDPLISPAFLHPRDHRDDPGVVFFKKSDDMRRGDIAQRLAVQTLKIQREVYTVRFHTRRGTQLRIAVREPAVRAIGGNRHNLRPCAEKDLKKLFPFFLRIGHFIAQRTHDGFDLGKIMIHRCADLAYGTQTVCPGGLDQLLLIAARKEQDRGSQDEQRDAEDRTDQQRAHANPVLFHTVSSASALRRSLAGLMPWYFLKQ